MTEIDIPLPTGATTAQVKRSVDIACRTLGLTISLETSLAGHPNSTHWHIKMGKEKGTLELTTWPGHRLLWAKIQAGRRADWIDRVLPQLSEIIQGAVDEA